MLGPPAKDAVRRLWGRRWLRRVSYLAVAGATVLTVGPWLLTRPAVLGWAAGKLDALAREETGLSLSIGRVEFHPVRGSLVLYDLHLGGDLLAVQRAEVQADLLSLAGPTPRIHAIRIDQPRLRLTEAGLSALKLKSRPPRQGPPPQVRLDLLSLTGGEVSVPEPLRGVPALRYQFEAKGTGLGPNHVRLDLTSTALAVQGPRGWEKGRLDLTVEAAEPFVQVQEGYLRLGESQLRLSGRFEAATPRAKAKVDAKVRGVVDLAQAAHWGGARNAPATGSLDLSGTLAGPLDDPAWTLRAEAQGLRPRDRIWAAGDLEVKAAGGLKRVEVDRLRWTSSQGEIDLRGGWSAQGPVQGSFEAANLDLEAVGKALRVPELHGTRATARGELHGPGNPEAMARLDRWRGALSMAFRQRGQEVGGLEASLDQGRAALPRLDLDLEGLRLHATGSALLGPRSRTQVEGEGTVEVGAGQVAGVLSAWKVVDLDMEGETRAQAQVRWSPSQGLWLDGSAEVAHPRWHGATADDLQARVEIRGSDLWIKAIDVRKDQGRGGGDIWLTWASLPPGQPQMDMCFTATRLPVAEGLKAADVEDEAHQPLPLTGLGSGWVRLQGPYAHILMSGNAQVESGEAYGIKIPAASSDFRMDLDSLELRLSDTRVAGRPDLLGFGNRLPEGELALQGRADLDLQNWTWRVDLGGRADTQLLALPGPRLQAQVEVRLLGPVTSPFGALDLPQGRASLTRGRLFLGDRSLEGLEGTAELDGGRLKTRVGLAGMAQPILDLAVHQQGADLAGDLRLVLAPESADTAALARGMTDDLLENLRVSGTASGVWKQGSELTWTGTFDRLEAQFSAFEMHQSKPSAVRGNAQGAELELDLRGGARDPAGAAAGPAAGMRVAGRVPFSKQLPMDIRATGATDLAHLKSILDRVVEVDEYSLLSELKVQGISSFNIRAHGTYSEPLLDGTLSLEKGQMHVRGYQGMEDLHFQAILKDRTLTIPPDQPLRGTLAHGDLRASGALIWRLGGLDAYAFKASLANFQFRDVPEGLNLEGSLEASLDGDESGGLLKGRLRADRVSYETEIKLGDLILRSALSGVGTVGGQTLDDPLDRIRLELDLDLRNPWSFDTNLLKLEGRTEGAFQVLGTLAQPVPKGTLIFKPGGRLTNIFPAGDMVVERGLLKFSETRPLDPDISIQGNVTSIPGYTVYLNIQGTMSNLTVIPSSSPSLRQDEIVAILINPSNAQYVGTAAATSGSTQGAITSGLASASTGLITTLAFAPFQDQLRRTLGLDRVSVAVRSTSTGGPETEVTLGKSVNLFGQRSAFVVSNKKTGEVTITSAQAEWRFGNIILQLGASKGGDPGIAPSGEIRHTWSPK